MKSDTLSEAVRWNTIASSIGSLLAFAGAVTLVAVIATVVKRHRPDAYGGLLWWSIGQLATIIVSNVGYPVLAVVAHGSDGYLAVDCLTDSQHPTSCRKRHSHSDVPRCRIHCCGNVPDCPDAEAFARATLARANIDLVASANLPRVRGSHSKHDVDR